MATVLTVGITAHDIILQVDDMPAGDGEFHARDRRQVIGGMAANAALAVSRLGGNGLISTRLGNDPIGEQIVTELSEARIDTQAVEWVNGARTSVSAIIVDAKGARLQVNHADPLLFRGPPRDYRDLDATVDIVMTDTRWAEGVSAALNFAFAAEIPSLIDFDSMPQDGAKSMLRRASHVAFSRQALIDLTGEASAEVGLRRAATMSGAWLAVTTGAGGVYWLDRNDVCHLPAYAVTAVDTLGADGVFQGALALALAEHMEIPDAIRFASAAATIKCQSFGGSGTPTRREVEQFIQERR